MPAREIVDTALQLPTLVRPPNARSTSSSHRPLIAQSLALARLFAWATTKGKRSTETAEFGLVEPGNPLIILDCSKQIFDALPSDFTTVDPKRIGGTALAFGQMSGPFGDLEIWVIGNRRPPRLVRSDVDRRRSSHFDSVRSVRLCLARLHAERETLSIVLGKLQSGSIEYEANSSSGDNLEQYLNAATRMVNRKSWGGIQQSAILEVFDAVESTTSYQQSRYLRQRLTGAREQIIRKVERFKRSSQFNLVGETIVVTNKTINIGDGASVVGPVVIADAIEGSFNQLAASKANEEVKDLMKTLLVQIAQVGNKVPPDVASQLADDAKILTMEISKTTPRRKWYELSLDGIAEAAKTVGVVGGPILETTAALLPTLIKLFP